jgi:hypothetical protein
MDFPAFAPRTRSPPTRTVISGAVKVSNCARSTNSSSAFGEGVQQNYVMAFAWCEIAQSNGQSDALECRDAALEHMTSAEIKQSFRLVTEWLGRHSSPSR